MMPVIPLSKNTGRPAENTVGTRLRSVLLLLLPLMVTAFVGVRAQIVMNDTHGLVGEEVRIALRYPSLPGDSSATVKMEGDLTLSNPTVFFPERFDPPVGAVVLDQRLTRLTDSTYTFSLAVRFDSGERPGVDTLCYLAGEALAGYDSVCVVRLSNGTLDGGIFLPASGVVTTTSIGTPRPYVRYATLERNYPNPVFRGAKTTWTYRIDKQSLVGFTIYNIQGEEVIVMNLGVQSPGVHQISLTPGYDVATGIYWARLHTNSGDAYQPMHVLR